MSLRGIVVMASGILPFVFLFWKLMAMGFGLSYRFKWVWAVDAASLSTIIALCAFLHIRWGALYRPGGAWAFYILAAIFFGLSILFTCYAFVLDKARHKAPEPSSPSDAPSS